MITEEHLTIRTVAKTGHTTGFYAFTSKIAWESAPVNVIAIGAEIFDTTPSIPFSAVHALNTDRRQSREIARVKGTNGELLTDDVLGTCAVQLNIVDRHENLLLQVFDPRLTGCHALQTTMLLHRSSQYCRGMHGSEQCSTISTFMSEIPRYRYRSVFCVVRNESAKYA